MTRCKKRLRSGHTCATMRTNAKGNGQRGGPRCCSCCPMKGADMQKQTMCMGRSPGGALFSGGRHTWRALPTFSSTVALAAGTRACTGQTSAAQHTGDTLAPGTRTGFSMREEVSKHPKANAAGGPAAKHKTKHSTEGKQRETENTWRTAKNFRKHRKQTEHSPRTNTGSQHWQRNATCKASVIMSPWRPAHWPGHLAHRGNPQAQT